MTNEELSIYKQTLANIKNEDEFIIKPFQSGRTFISYIVMITNFSVFKDHQMNPQ